MALGIVTCVRKRTGNEMRKERLPLTTNATRDAGREPVRAKGTARHSRTADLVGTDSEAIKERGVSARESTGTTAENTRQGTRAALLAATRQLMIQHGTVDISISTITDKAQVNSALVRYYFGNKEGLLYALLQTDVSTVLEDMQALVKSTKWSPPEKLAIHLRATISTLYDAFYINRLLQSLVRDASPSRLNQIDEEIVRPVIATHGEILRQGIVDGYYYQVDPVVFYYMVLGVGDSLNASRQTRQRAADGSTRDDEIHSRHIDESVAILMRGVLLPQFSGEATKGRPRRARANLPKSALPVESTKRR